MSNNPNTNENNLAVYDERNVSIMPRNLEAQIADAVNTRNALSRLFEGLLEIKIDFDRIPGTDRPTLLKPGAELLCKVFKLAQGKADVLEREEDWEKGIFSYTIGLPLIHIESGFQISYGIGAANSMEKKYRYRKMKTPDGQEVQIENPDPADLQNTLIKMANKRAYVDAVLKATGASRMFTQDMEDFGAMTGQFEKASSKQIGFIKTLFKSFSEASAIAELSEICGREVKSFDDIYRTEASRIIDVKKGKSGSGAAHAQPPVPMGPPNPAGPPSDYFAFSDADSYGEQTASNDSGRRGQQGASLACADCGIIISGAEYGYSSKKHGRPLCRSCQNNARQGA
jgi:hypothetical protein